MRTLLHALPRHWRGDAQGAKRRSPLSRWRCLAPISIALSSCPFRVNRWRCMRLFAREGGYRFDGKIQLVTDEKRMRRTLQSNAAFKVKNDL